MSLSTKRFIYFYVSLLSFCIASVLISSCTRQHAASKSPGPKWEGFPKPESTGATLSTAQEWGQEPEWTTPKPSELPLEIIHKAPTSSEIYASAVLVAFNQPMVRLGKVKSRNEAPDRFPIQIHPPVKANYRWVAGNTLKAEFSKPAKNATRYTITIPANTSSLSGARLKEDHVWSFETLRPELNWVQPLPEEAQRADSIRPNDKFLLFFNIRVDPGSIKKHLVLEMNKKKIGYDLKKRKTEDEETLDRLYVLTPRRLMEKGASITIKTRPGIKTPEGPLSSIQKFKRDYQVYKPLTISLLCGGEEIEDNGSCKPMNNDYHQGIYLRFSEPVSRDELLSHIQVRPRIKNLKDALHTHYNRCHYSSNDSCSRRWNLRVTLQANKRYKISVRKPLKDIYGQNLKKTFVKTFKTTDYPPDIFTPTEEEAFREPWHPYFFSTVNTKKVKVRKKEFQGKELIKFLVCLRKNRDDWPKECWQKENKPQKPQFVFKTSEKKKNKITKHKISLSHGITAMELSSPQVLTYKNEIIPFYRLAVRTNLGIHARMSPYGLVTWVSTLDKGEPVAKGTVSVFDKNGKKLAEKVTDQNGVAEFHENKSIEALTSKKKPPFLYVHVSTEGDESYLGIPGTSYRHWSNSKGSLNTPYGSCNRYDCIQQYYGTSSHYRANTRYNISTTSIWRGPRPKLAGYISTERGIYRPGHTIHLHGAVREFRESNGAPYAHKTVTVELRGPDRSVLSSIRKKTGEMGVFMGKMKVPQKGSLGFYRLYLKRNDKLLDVHYFRVAEYRPPRFEVRMHMTPKRIINVREITIGGIGTYLFGGPLGGAEYKLSVTRTPMSIHPHGYDGYHMGGWSSTAGEKTRWALKEGVLSKKGRMKEVLDLSKHIKTHYPWPAYHIAELEITSSAQRSVSARKRAYHSPGNLYPAVRSIPDKEGVVRRHVRVLAIGNTQKPHLEWNERGGHVVSARLFSAHDYEPQGRNKALWEKKFSVPKSGIKLDIPWPKDYSKYSAILILSVTDNEGREARTADHLYRPNEYSRAWQKEQQLQKQKRAMLSVETDKKKYLPGETAVITVTRRKTEDNGLLFVEREKTFSTHPLRFNAQNKATVNFKVQDWMAMQVNLRAILVRSYKDLRGEMGPLVTASANLNVSAKPFTLNVGIKTDKKQYRPREKVRVNIKVTDGLKRKRKAQVVLMAVDESVLRLTNYRLPNPFRKLFVTPADQIYSDDLRRYLAHLGILEVHRDHAELTDPSGRGTWGAGFGGGGGSGAGGRGSYGIGGLGKRKGKPRRLFLTTPWHTTLMTNDEGEAETSFSLPDNLTDYRIMAFALDNDRSSGTGSTNFKVDLPLLTLPSLPRFSRVGDEFSGGVVVYNTGVNVGDAVVKARVDGQKIKLTGKNTQTIALPQGKDTRVEFRFKALKAGAAKIKFDVQLGGERDTTESLLPIRKATFTEAASVSGETKSAVLQGIERLSNVQPDHGGLELQLASTALVGIEDGMEQLIHYPYGCLEQQSSRLLPMIVAAAMGERFNLKMGKDPIPRIRAGIAAVLAMQRPDGGFGYWPNSPTSLPWATAYAMIVFNRIESIKKSIGITVPQSASRRALHYLSNIMKSIRFYGPYWWSNETFILYALSLYNRDVSKRVLERFEDRKNQPLFARAMLLSSMARLLKAKDLIKGKKRAALEKARSTLTGEISNSLRVDGTWAHAEERLSRGYKVLMHSNDRSTAMVLMSLLEAKPNHPMIPRLVRWFLLGRKQATFRNTQEAAWALMAIWDYATIREKETPDFEAGVWMGGERILKAEFRGRSTKPKDKNIPMQELLLVAGRAARDLVIAKRGTGTLYYVARLRYARTKLPDKARNRGFEIKRTLQVLDSGGSPVSTSREPKFGDTVLITLHVKTNEARRYVVIEDPLPAGLEAIDTSLATAGRSFGTAQIWEGISRFDHKELRDHRVSFFRDHMQPGAHIYRYLARVTTTGKFITPPTKAEEMYTPEVFGHTPGRIASFK